MGAAKHAVRVVDGGGFALPVRRQPPLVVGYEHFRLDRQGALLSRKFATVAAKLGRNFEHLRAAMGHSDYGVL